MKMPGLIHADQLADKKHPHPIKEVNGQWVLCRPIPFYGFRQRLQLAWQVFTGKYDALKWHDQ